MRLHEESVAVQHGEPVDDVSADPVIDVLGVELATAGLSVGGPVGEVADDLVVSRQAVTERPVIVVRSGRFSWRLPGLVPVLGGGGGGRGSGGRGGVGPLRELRNDRLLGQFWDRDDPRVLLLLLASTAGLVWPSADLHIFVPVEAVRTGLLAPLLVDTPKVLSAVGGGFVALSAGDFKARLTVVFGEALVPGGQVQYPGLGLDQGGGLGLHSRPQRGHQGGGGGGGEVTSPGWKEDLEEGSDEGLVIVERLEEGEVGGGPDEGDEGEQEDCRHPERYWDCPAGTVNQLSYCVSPGT